MKRWGDKRWVLNLAFNLALAIPILILFGPAIAAQEIIDPRSGQLVLSVTDLTIQAGPVTLEIQRSLDTGKRQPGLLGPRWRLNWESRLLRAGPLVLIQESTGSLSFSQQGPAGEYRSAMGDRLVFNKTAQAIRTKSDGTKETFDAQGRLVERDYRNGNRAVLRYGSDGRVTRIDGPHGSFIRFTMDKAGRVVQVEASTTATVRYAYQGDDLTEVQRPPAPPVRYSYLKDGRLARIEEPQFGTVQFDYDFKGRVSRRHWADGSQERYEYNDPTTTIRQIDPAGGVTTIQWSRDKRLAEITNPLGHKSVTISDAVGRPLQITGPTGASARLTYDALGRTIAMEIPAGQVTRFEYLGETSQPRAIFRPDGTRQLFEYDRRGNLTALKLGTETLAAFTYHPDGSVATAKGLGTPERRLTYDPAGRLAAVANALGETYQFAYDTRGNLTQETNPLGGATRYQYDAQDRPVSRTDPVGGLTRYEYDPQGRLSRITDPMGGVTRYEYDARGRLVAETNPAGQATRYEYDVTGRLAKVTEPSNLVESYRYDVVGNLTEWTDRLRRTMQFDYDPLGRLNRERWPTGLEVHYRYDAIGNLIGFGDSTGAKREFQHDVYGRTTANVNPLGAVTRSMYDQLGNLMSLAGPLGQVMRFAYSRDGVLVTAQEPSGDTAQYEYDRGGRLIVIRHPGGGMTRLAYDAMGNLARVTDPLGKYRCYSYDVAGRLVSATDASGRVTRYLYDRSGRLAEKQLPDGRRVTYQYDRLGNLLQADDGVFPVRLRYDQGGRPIRIEYPAIKKTVGYEYDAFGLRTKLIDPEGRATRYEYNSQKQLAAIVLPDGKRLGLSYDVKNRLQSIRFPNGITGRWEYDAVGRIAKIHHRDEKGHTVAGWTYRYNLSGNPVEQADSQGRTVRLEYDVASRLLESAGPDGTTRYRYLPGGNRAIVEEGGSATQYRYDFADQLLQAGGERFSYDANGNLIARKGPGGTTAYEYDTEEQLVKVVGPNGETTAFGYAPTGERVWQKDKDGLRYYLYDGLHVIQELEETGTPKTTYVHGPGIDRPLAMTRDGRSHYYHAERLGSIRLLTDDRGQAAAAYDYDAFGGLRAPPGSVPNPFTFTGRELDQTTGLYYYRARYYDPVLGRFLAKDPVGGYKARPASLNRYAYVENKPLTYRDPLGLAGEEEFFWHYGPQGAVEGIQEQGFRFSTPPGRPHETGVYFTTKNPAEIARNPGQIGLLPGKTTHAVGPIPRSALEAQGWVIRPDPAHPPHSYYVAGREVGGRTITARSTSQSGVYLEPPVPLRVHRVPGGGRSGATLPFVPFMMAFAGRDIITLSETDPKYRPHVGASMAGGWIGGTAAPLLVGCIPGVGQLGLGATLLVGLAGSCIGSGIGGSIVPPPTDLPPLTVHPGELPPPVQWTPGETPPPGQQSVDPTSPGDGTVPVWPICHPYNPNDPACEPKTGAGPKQPDVKGASEQPVGGGIPPAPGTSGVTGGGEPIPIPGQQTGPTGAGEPGTAGQPPPQQGYWCYSKTTKEWYQIPYGPCPPSDRKPSGDPSVRIPWQGLTPPPDTVAPTSGGCPPGCHIKPGTTMCHCPGGSPGKPSGGG